MDIRSRKKAVTSVLSFESKRRNPCSYSASPSSSKRPGSWRTFADSFIGAIEVGAAPFRIWEKWPISFQGEAGAPPPVRFWAKWGLPISLLSEVAQGEVGEPPFSFLGEIGAALFNFGRSGPFRVRARPFHF